MKKQLITSYTTTSPEKTMELGIKIGKNFDKAIVAFSGDLGAGKTLLSRSICLGAGIDEDMISSPTFTLINQYTGGRVLVHHMDTYRLDSESFMDLGLEEILMGEGLKLIEWAERIEDFLPLETLFIEIKHIGEFERQLDFYSYLNHWAKPVQQLFAN